MRRLLLLIICLVWLAPLPAAAHVLLVVGDSLSAAFGMDVRSGWVALLEKRLARDKSIYQVVNASISGDTTANGLARLPRLLAEYQPAVVIIELGANDGLRGLSLVQMKHNITAMVTKAKGNNARVLLVGMRLPPNYGNAYAAKFQRVYREIAREQRVALVPFMLDGIATDGALMQQDGLHPNAQAQARILKNVRPHLRPLLQPKDERGKAGSLSEPISKRIFCLENESMKSLPHFNITGSAILDQPLYRKANDKPALPGRTISRLRRNMIHRR